MEFDKCTDAELLELLQKHNRQAFNALYHRYFAKLYSVTYKRVKSREVAEEIIQELFTALWIKRDSLLVDHSFASYIFTAVKYMIFKYFRSEGIRKVHTENMKVSYSDLGNYTEEAVFFNDLNLRFEDAVNNLPAKSRIVFGLSRREHKSNKEIAVQLDITEKTVEYHITKALALLRISLKEFAAILFVLTIHHF